MSNWNIDLTKGKPIDGTVITKAKVWHRDLTEQEMIDVYNGKDVKCNCAECKPKGL